MVKDENMPMVTILTSLEDTHGTIHASSPSIANAWAEVKVQENLKSFRIDNVCK